MFECSLCDRVCTLSELCDHDCSYKDSDATGSDSSGSSSSEDDTVKFAGKRPVGGTPAAGKTEGNQGAFCGYAQALNVCLGETVDSSVYCFMSVAGCGYVRGSLVNRTPMWIGSIASAVRIPSTTTGFIESLNNVIKTSLP